MDDKNTRPAEPAPGYYAVIPAQVRYDDRLSGKAALLYGEITALASAEGYCWASNSYFAELYHVQPATIRNWIKDLEDCGHIRREELRDPETNELIQRRIWIVNPPSYFLPPSGEKTTDPPSQKQHQNNIDYNITPYSPPKGDGEGGAKKEKKPTLAQQREQWFDCLWEIYPNHGARAPALKRWLRMRPDVDFARKIYRAVQAQVKARKWSPGYWPELRRWLQDERWNDELPQCAGEETGGTVVESEEVVYW